MFRQVLAVAGKELQILLKDRAGLAVLFLLPLLLATVIGGPSTFSNAASENAGEEPTLQLDVYIVNQDSGAYGDEVVKALRGISVLRVATYNSAELADERVADGERIAAIIIPADFSQQIDAGKPTRVQVVSDPAQEEGAGIVVGIVEQAVAEMGIVAEIRYGIRAVIEQTGSMEGAPPEMWQAVEAQTLGAIWTQVQKLRQEPIIEVRNERLKETEDPIQAGPMDWYITAMTVMFAFFLLPTIGESILREKEQGSFRRLLAAPMPRAAIIAGFMLAYALVVFLQVAFLFGVGRLVFGNNLGPSLLGLFLITLLIALASASLGLLIGAVARSSEQANSLGMMLGFVLAIVGGCILPWFRMGGVAKTISSLVPHAHGLQAYTGLMVDGLTLAQISPHLLALAGFALVFFMVALWRFRFE